MNVFYYSQTNSATKVLKYLSYIICIYMVQRTSENGVFCYRNTYGY